MQIGCDSATFRFFSLIVGDEDLALDVTRPVVRAVGFVRAVPEAEGVHGDEQNGGHDR